MKIQLKMEYKMKQKLIMIMNKIFNKSGVKVAPLFSKFNNKKMSLGEQNRS